MHRILEGAGFSEVSLTPLDPEIQLAGPKGEAEAADFVMVMGPLVRVLPSLWPAAFAGSHRPKCLLLGVILIAATLKGFWRRGH